jgi:hypothetical protein
MIITLFQSVKEDRPFTRSLGLSGVTAAGRNALNPCRVRAGLVYLPSLNQFRRMSMSSIAFACVLVNVPNQSTIAQSDRGVYQVVFAPVFSDFPVINVTQFFNGQNGNTLSNVTQNVGYSSGSPTDNATGVFVERQANGTYVAQVVTGNQGNGELWRSFALSAMGPAANP